LAVRLLAAALFPVLSLPQAARARADPAIKVPATSFPIR
jgi:hypothetical protein